MNVIHVISWIWVFLLLAADLKVAIHPYIHWGISLLAFVLMLPLLALAKFRIRCQHQIQWFAVLMMILLIISVLLTGLTTENAFYSLIQAFKLSAILLMPFLLFTTRSDLARVGLFAATAAVWTNLSFLLLGITLSPVFARQMAADGRWGTFLNYPGSLWRVGILVLVFSTYLFYHKRKDFRFLALLIASLCLIYADGSRTGFIMTFASIVYVGIIVLMEKRRYLQVGLVLAFTGLGGALFIGMLFSDHVIISTVLPNRLEETIQAVVSGNLEQADSARFLMFLTAFQSISDHPLWGTGIGTTQAELDAGAMVIHNTYLQVWSDLGILGFLAYIGLVLGWILWLPHFFTNVRQQGNIMQRSIAYNAVFLLFFYSVSGLFHPLSTEWSEWITFMISFALYVEALNTPEGEI